MCRYSQVRGLFKTVWGIQDSGSRLYLAMNGLDLSRSTADYKMSGKLTNVINVMFLVRSRVTGKKLFSMMMIELHRI